MRQWAQTIYQRIQWRSTMDMMIRKTLFQFQFQLAECTTISTRFNVLLSAEVFHIFFIITMLN